MSSPAVPGDGKPMPALLSPGTARSIRDALVDAERAEFERRFAEEMASAAQTLDLGRVLQVLSTYRKVAEITQRHGARRSTATSGEAAVDLWRDPYQASAVSA